MEYRAYVILAEQMYKKVEQSIGFGTKEIDFNCIGFDVIISDFMNITFIDEQAHTTFYKTFSKLMTDSMNNKANMDDASDKIYHVQNVGRKYHDFSEFFGTLQNKLSREINEWEKTARDVTSMLNKTSSSNDFRKSKEIKVPNRKEIDALTVMSDIFKKVQLDCANEEMYKQEEELAKEIAKRTDGLIDAEIYAHNRSKIELAKLSMQITIEDLSSDIKTDELVKAIEKVKRLLREGKIASKEYNETMNDLNYELQLNELIKLQDHEYNQAKFEEELIRSTRYDVRVGNTTQEYLDTVIDHYSKSSKEHLDKADEYGIETAELKNDQQTKLLYRKFANKEISKEELDKGIKILTDKKSPQTQPVNETGKTI